MKIKIDLGAGILMLLIGTIALILPVFQQSNLIFTLKFLFLFNALINFGRFILNRKTNDKEGLYTSLCALILFIILFIIKISNSSLTLSLFVFIWVIALSFIRLKKADYYHDQKNKMWILEITTLIIFIMIGLLTSFSILLTKDGNIFMIGFLFFMNSFIEVIDPVVQYIKE